MLTVEKKKIKSENQNPRLVAITLVSTAMVLVMILCLWMWKTGCRVYKVKDGNKVQIRAGSRKNKGIICEATEEIIDEAKNDDNVILSRYSTEVTFL